MANLKLVGGVNFSVWAAQTNAFKYKICVSEVSVSRTFFIRETLLGTHFFNNKSKIFEPLIQKTLRLPRALKNKTIPDKIEAHLKFFRSYGTFYPF